jgi:hypothetical protein
MIEGYERIEIEDEKLALGAGMNLKKNSITMAEVKIIITADGTSMVAVGQTMRSRKVCEHLLGADGFCQFWKELGDAVAESHALQECVHHMGEIMVRHSHEGDDGR